MFQEELKFFQQNQNSFVSQYFGKILVIKGNILLGIYDTALVALKETTKNYELGSFMIQPCIPGPDAYTVTINSLGIIGAKA